MRQLSSEKEASLTSDYKDSFTWSDVGWIRFLSDLRHALCLQQSTAFKNDYMPMAQYILYILQYSKEIVKDSSNSLRRFRF